MTSAAPPSPPRRSARSAIDGAVRRRSEGGGDYVVRLSAPADFRLLDLGGIADDVVVTTGARRAVVTVHLDTPDLRLARWGAGLSHRSDEGWTVTVPDPLSGGGRRELRLEGSPGNPPAEALDLLTAYVRHATLAPVARLRTVREVVDLRTHEGRRLAAIDDDEVSVLDGRRVAARFREVDVSVEAEHQPLLEGILERLHAAGAGLADPTPALVHVLGARATAAPEVAVDAVDRDAAAGQVVRRAFAASVVRLLRHDAAARIGEDPEGVHQARVATRRLRSDLRTFESLLAVPVAGLRADLAILADALGRVRDAEVLRDRLAGRLGGLRGEDAGPARRLLTELDAEVASGREALLLRLRSREYADLLERLVQLASTRGLLGAAELHPADQALDPLVAAPWRRLQRAARGVGDDADDAALHEIRIRAKRVRYACEAVGPVLGRRAAELGEASARLQEVLGEHQDAVIAERWLRDRAGRSTAFLAGQLVAAERLAAAEARRRWPRAWRRVRRRRPSSWR